MSVIDEYIRDIRSSDNYEGQIVHHEEIDAREPEYDDVNHILHEKMRGYLDDAGSALFSPGEGHRPVA
jgi:DEAD/DEAH box helicase domain-containing protein